ncbi:MAG TPA: CsgG/HfaB family protein [Treponemataceae bacterium]|nr:CsgG/HfaB family protein [Treponemataceae bacterium]
MSKKAFVAVLFLCLGFSQLAAQKVYSLEKAVYELARGVSSKLQQGTKIVIYDIQAEKSESSAFLIDELTRALLDIGSLRVVDRGSIEKIQDELSFQMSGDVSDESAQRLGAILGAESLLTGSFDSYKGKYRLTLKSIQVETSEIQYMGVVSIIANAETDALLGRKAGPNVAVVAVGSAARSVADFSSRVVCSTINPFLGMGSYIQGDFEGGGTVTFWELASIAGIAYFGRNDDISNSDVSFMTAVSGGVLIATVVYAIIRPWRFNRDPSVASVLPSFSLGFDASVLQEKKLPLSVQWTIRY